MSSESGVVLGVDVGGTKILAGAVESDGRVGHTVQAATPGRAVEVTVVEDAVVAAVAQAAAGRMVSRVGVAVAGFVDASGEHVMFAPHLPWRGEPVREVLEQRLGVPVTLENDATCAALAESTYGAALGVSSAVVVTVGTGIGGGVIVGGEVWRGATGMAGEFGHMQVVPDGSACECGRSGCWEQYCSGRALVRRAREQMRRTSSVLDIACAGVEERLTGDMVTAAALKGDSVALEACRTVGAWLGTGIANLVAALDPEIVVVGGGVAVAGDLLLAPARQALARDLVGAGHRSMPSVVVAQLGAAAGVIGAAELARG